VGQNLLLIGKAARRIQRQRCGPKRAAGEVLAGRVRFSTEAPRSFDEIASALSTAGCSLSKRAYVADEEQETT
jgi:hypothetical protein